MVQVCYTDGHKMLFECVIFSKSEDEKQVGGHDERNIVLQWN